MRERADVRVFQTNNLYVWAISGAGSERRRVGGPIRIVVNTRPTWQSTKGCTQVTPPEKPKSLRHPLR